MSSNYPELVFTEDEDFTADRLNKAMQVLDQRLRSLEPFSPSWEAAVNDLRAVGLSRLNDAILPAYERIQQLTELGFLFAGSNSSVTLVQDQSKTFIIDDETERALFTPTPFLALTRSSTTADYGIAQFVSYDNDTGELMVLVKAVTGNPGPHTDWQIGALAGNTLAGLQYFTQIDAARVDALASKNASAANATQTSADRVQVASDRVQTGLDRVAAAASAENAKLWDPTNYALKTYVDAVVTNLINGAPGALDTLKELADALGADSNFSATIAAALAKRARVDAVQTFTAAELLQLQANIGLVRGTASELLANSNDNVVTTGKAWAATAFVNLGNVSGSINIDCSTGSRFRLVLVGNTTINFINPKDGQVVDLAVVQDGTGGRTVSWASNIRFPDAIAPTVATAATGWAVIFSGVYCALATQWLAAGWKVN